MFGLQFYNEMEKMNRERNQLFHGFGLSSALEDRMDRSELRVRDIGESYQVEATLPGIDTEKLEINVLGRQLSLLAEVADSGAGEAAVWHRRERKRSEFKKSFMLPEDIDSDKVAAEYKNGILLISLPKAASALPKKSV